MVRVTYENLCPAGHRIDLQAKEIARRLTEVARILIDTEANDYTANLPRYRAEITDTKAQRDKHNAQLMQHVAHCTDGCVRTQDGATAFAAENQSGVYDRAPSHKKPTMPGAGDLAARLAAGATLDDLSTEFERTTRHLRHVLIHAGFHGTTGEPKTTSKPAAAPSAGRIDDQPWAPDAACTQTDPEAFYPDKGGSTKAAKAVCATCVVQAECLDYALDRDERFGVWGGLSERERRKIAKAIDPAIPDDTGACGTYPRGYGRHQKLGEEPCDDCRQAAAIYTGNRRRYGRSLPVDIDDLEGPGSGIPPNTQPLNTIQETA